MKRLLAFILGLAFLQNQVLAQEPEIRKLEPFSRVHVSGSMDVVLIPGNEESVKIVAKGLSSSRINTEVSDGDLHVYLEDGDYKNIVVKVYINFKQIELVDKSGSGNLDFPSAYSAQALEFNISGTGNFAAGGNIKASHLKISGSGSGEIKFLYLEAGEVEILASNSGRLNIMAGQATRQSINLSGTANISSSGFKTDECIASLNGTGSIEVAVSKTLQATIAGSGNLVYNGNPEIVRKTITGTGKLAKRS